MLPARQRASISGALLVGLGFILAVATLPRIGSSLATIVGDSAARSLKAGGQGVADRAGILLRSRQNAVALHESGRLWAELATARLLVLDQRRAIRAERDLPQVRDELRQSLALAPANPYAWSQLAVVEEALGASVTLVSRLLRQSFLTGPFQRDLAELRRGLALRVGSADENAPAASKER